MNRLEILCRPLIRLLCESWCSAKAGAPIDAEEFRRKIQLCREQIVTECAADPNLKREFSRIERPLIFFVDYTIKEGVFPFRQKWFELARDYNELSGDEKFFDLLAENLDDPEASERLMVFYLLMGLGFDGCLHGTPHQIEKRMKLCATRFELGRSLNEQSWFTPVPTNGKKTRQFCRTLLFYVFGVALLFAALSFGYNYAVFKSNTRAYRAAINAANDQARPVYKPQKSSGKLPIEELKK